MKSKTKSYGTVHYVIRDKNGKVKEKGKSTMPLDFKSNKKDNK